MSRSANQNDGTSAAAVPEASRLAVTYSGPADSWQISVPAETVMRLIAPFDGRRRAVLTALLNGSSKSMAAVSAGVTTRSVQLWEKADEGFQNAVALAERIGFACIIESELYRRALAGAEDRGSMRALEMVVKSRDAAYREKAQVTLDVVHRAEDNLHRLTAGWDSDSESDTAE